MIGTIIGTLFCFIRKMVLAIILISAFAYEPTFELIHGAIYYVHIVVRAALLDIRARFAFSSSTDLATWLTAYLRAFLVFLAPVLRPFLPRVTFVGTELVRASPRLLCYVNGGVVEAGKYLMDVIMEGNPGELGELWKATGKEVAGFCQAEVENGGGLKFCK